MKDRPDPITPEERAAISSYQWGFITWAELTLRLGPTRLLELENMGKIRRER